MGNFAVDIMWRPSIGIDRWQRARSAGAICALCFPGFPFLCVQCFLCAPCSLRSGRHLTTILNRPYHAPLNQARSFHSNYQLPTTTTSTTHFFTFCYYPPGKNATDTTARGFFFARREFGFGLHPRDFSDHRASTLRENRQQETAGRNCIREVGPATTGYC